MREWIVIGALVGVLCASQAWPQGQPYTYTTLTAPDAAETHADGLNEYAEVVGVFTTHLGDVPYLLQGLAYNPITPNMANTSWLLSNVGGLGSLKQKSPQARRGWQT